MKSSPDLTLLFNEFENVIPENHSDPENVISSRYYDIDKFYVIIDVTDVIKTWITKNICRFLHLLFFKTI